MKKYSPLTPFGLEVKKRLLDLGVSQKEFCQIHGFHPTYFSAMLYGVRPMRKIRLKTAEILGISPPE